MSHPFIPMPNVALIEMVYNFGNQIIENTFHVRAAAPFSALDLQGLCNTFDSWDNAATNGWKSIRVLDNSLFQIKGRALDTNSSPVYIFALPTPRSGTRVSGTTMPGNVTFCATLQTGLAGRSYRGRLFTPGMKTGDIQAAPNNGLVNSAYAGAVVASLNTLIALLAAHSPVWTLVVVSYYNSGAWRTTGVATPITNAAYPDLAVDNQRRRLPGRGR